MWPKFYQSPSIDKTQCISMDKPAIYTILLRVTPFRPHTANGRLVVTLQASESTTKISVEERSFLSSSFPPATTNI